MVLIKSSAEIEQEEKAAIELDVKQDDRSQLAGLIWSFWEEAKRAKEDVEDTMELNIRQRNGEYTATKLADIQALGGSEIFMTLTDEKCTAAKSWLVDVLMPPDDKPWGVESTPVADLPSDQIDIIRNKVQSDMVTELQEMQALGQPLDEDVLMSRIEDVTIDIQNKVKQRAKNYENNTELAIEDVLVEGGWKEAFKKVIDDIVDLPAGIMKGPIIEREDKLAWTKTPDGWKADVVEALIPTYKRISPFDIYPAASATTFDDGDVVELHRLTYEDLTNLIGQPGYNDEELEKVIEDYNDGILGDWADAGDSSAVITQEQEEEEDQYELSVQHSVKIQAIQYWGCVRGEVLVDWGFKGKEISFKVAL